jgi:hypothetical protein
MDNFDAETAADLAMLASPDDLDRFIRECRRHLTGDHASYYAPRLAVYEAEKARRVAS